MLRNALSVISNDCSCSVKATAKVFHSSNMCIIYTYYLSLRTLLKKGLHGV